jgi:hypothetical protein
LGSILDENPDLDPPGVQGEILGGILPVFPVNNSQKPHTARTDSYKKYSKLRVNNSLVNGPVLSSPAYLVNTRLSR